MVRAKDLISIYQTLSAYNIRVWLTGGWGIDALLQEQTRPHKDLDIPAFSVAVATKCVSSLNEVI